MINFFRKTRKKLADDNPPAGVAGKPLKYMRYAIGEIVLVVIGILIALSINNWNEERKFRIIESSYLERLKNDIGTDIEYLNERILINNKANDHLKLFIKKSYDTQESIQDVRILFSNLHLNTDPLASANSTYRELISTGDLNIFQNDSLKNSIIDYYRINEDLSLQIEEYNQVSTGLLIQSNQTIPNFAKLFNLYEFSTTYLDGEWDFINEPSSIRFQTLEGLVYTYFYRNKEHLVYLNRLKSISEILFIDLNQEINMNNPTP